MKLRNGIKISLIIVLGVFVFLFICVAGIYWIFDALDNAYHSSIKETHSAEDFLSEAYLEYNGGKEANEFFKEYVQLDHYKDLSFHYKDGEKMIALHNYCTSFVVDIYCASSKIQKTR